MQAIISAPICARFYGGRKMSKERAGGKTVLKLRFLFIVEARNLKFGVVVTFKM